MKNIAEILGYHDIKIGQVYDFKRKYTYEDVSTFATLSGDKNPLKRNATVEDVSSVVSFRASDRSDFLNGTNITVNGGGVLL